MPTLMQPSSIWTEYGDTNKLNQSLEFRQNITARNGAIQKLDPWENITLAKSTSFRLKYEQ